MEPRIQYARTSNGVNIAYAVFGSGPAIVLPTGIWGALYMYSNFRPRSRPRLYDRLASLGWSVITYDGRGTGASDRGVDDWTLEARLRDLDCVIERAASERFALCGIQVGGPAAVTYAVRHPDRVAYLVLSNTYATGAEWYEVVPAMRLTQRTLRDAEDQWEFTTLTLANALFGYKDSELARRAAKAMAAGLTPKAYIAFREAAEKIDVRGLLPQIAMPTLVVHDRSIPMDRIGVVTQRLAPLIPNARFVGTDDLAQVIDEFLREGGLEPTPPEPTAQRGLPSGTAVILFADIADSTALTERLGDAAFRAKARKLAG